MTPQRKKPGRDPTPNFYEKFDKRTRKTYYAYRDPRTGKFHGLGTDRAAAIADAKALNTLIASHIASARTRAIANTSGPTFAEFTKRYFAILSDERKLSANTDRTRTHIVGKCVESLGKRLVTEIDVHHCAALINAYRERGKQRMAQSVRSVLVDIFRVAISEGIRTDNPAAATRNPRVEVKRERLTLDQFRAILVAAEQQEDPWVSNSMLLALVTGQRREDIARMKFRDVRDGYLEIVQGKTGTQIKISTSLRLIAIGISVADVIARCRDNVISPHMIHHTQPRTHSRPGDAVHKDTISRAFARARELAGITSATPPTFHEIRSLAGRLYRNQGVDVKSLLGHADSRMTDTYTDTRGHDWIVVGG